MTNIVSNEEVSSDDYVSDDDYKERTAHGYRTHNQTVDQRLLMVHLVIDKVAYTPPVTHASSVLAQKLPYASITAFNLK